MTYDDPNRESVGLAPIWTGAGGATEPPPGEGGEEGPFDPGEHTVDDVLAYVDAHPDQTDAVLAAEQSGKGRVTLINALAGE